MRGRCGALVVGLVIAIVASGCTVDAVPPGGSSTAGAEAPAVTSSPAPAMTSTSPDPGPSASPAPSRAAVDLLIDALPSPGLSFDDADPTPPPGCDLRLMIWFPSFNGPGQGACILDGERCEAVRGIAIENGCVFRPQPPAGFVFCYDWAPGAPTALFTQPEVLAPTVGWSTPAYCEVAFYDPRPDSLCKEGGVLTVQFAWLRDYDAGTAPERTRELVAARAFDTGEIRVDEATFGEWEGSVATGSCGSYERTYAIFALTVPGTDRVLEGSWIARDEADLKTFADLIAATAVRGGPVQP